MINHIYKKNNNGKHINGAIYPTIYYYQKNIYQKDTVFPHSDVMFEGKKYHAYHDTDKYLTQLYGDYMTLPPVDKRIAYRPIKLDFNHGDNLNTKIEYEKLNKR